MPPLQFRRFSTENVSLITSSLMEELVPIWISHEIFICDNQVNAQEEKLFSA
ncbi:11732_t:CDS:2 [Funneliformis geosporum]|uniref:1619_t:CDS:1 n=1 Tax=Funneliformis geosporum TaxID=1117311 RepID=A0A9W4WVD2_9GLOM|nr:1619_t:CDS:2 [Funneliformis geosporum]CAI2167231.1 11732_t:CDS:2 [Funneliformis geosporum]